MVGGLLSGSLALLADAGHLLMGVVAIVVALVVFWYAGLGAVWASAETPRGALLKKSSLP